MRRAGGCSRSSGCRLRASATEVGGARDHGKEESNHSRAAHTEVLDPGGQPLPAVRPQPRLHAEVWRLPHMFPRTGVAGSVAGRDQVELVEIRVARSDDYED